MNNRVKNIISINMRKCDPEKYPRMRKLLGHLKRLNKLSYVWGDRKGNIFATQLLDNYKIELTGKYEWMLWGKSQRRYVEWPTDQYLNDIIRVSDWNEAFYARFIPDMEEFRYAKRKARGRVAFFIRAKRKVHFFAYLDKRGQLVYEELVYFPFLATFNRDYVIDDFSNSEMPEEVPEEDDVEDDLYEQAEPPDFDDDDEPYFEEYLIDPYVKEGPIYISKADYLAFLEEKGHTEDEVFGLVNDLPQAAESDDEAKQVRERIDRILEDIAMFGLENIIAEDRAFLERYSGWV